MIKTIFLVACLLGLCIAKTVTISNVEPRIDLNGNIVNAHDGCIVKFGDTFFMYGTVYERCNQDKPTCNGKCGYLNNTFALYTSEDMATWTLHTASVLPEMEKDHMFIDYWMPNVGFNNVTGLYVMAYWSGHYGFRNSKVAIASSRSPYGPFINQNPIVLHGGSVISSTVNMFVDPDDGTAYIRYNTRDPPLRHVVESLNPDWTKSSGSYATVFVKRDYPWYEGGGFFKRKDVFYITIGTDCCFCQWGGDALTFKSTRPLISWSHVGESNFCHGGEMPRQRDLNGTQNPCDVTNFKGVNFTIPAQQFNTITIPSPSGPTFLYYGERYRSSLDGLKAHDFQAWIPFNFSEDGQIQHMNWVDQFELEI